MTTITLNINEKTKKGKALLAFLEAFYVGKDEVQVVKEPKSPYNKEFVKTILDTKHEKTIAVTSKNIWEIID